MLRKKYPKDEFFLIIGSDMFLIFDRWYRYNEILETCTVCVEARENEDKISELEKYAKEHLNIDVKTSDRVIIANVKPYPVSSTEIRRKIKDGRGVKRLLGEKVSEYIKNRGLYRG
jgi:nicotinate-nucleotide adenylyltransferase